MSGFELLHQGELLKASVQASNDEVTVQLQDKLHRYRRIAVRGGKQLFENSQGQLSCRAVRNKDRIWVWVNGHSFEFTIPSADSAHGGGGQVSSGDARAPMPGTIIKLSVSVGDTVEAGQVMAILEAMKMEHQIRAPRTGTVAQIHGSVGEIIDAGALVVSLAEEQ